MRASATEGPKLRQVSVYPSHRFFISAWSVVRPQKKEGAAARNIPLNITVLYDFKYVLRAAAHVVFESIQFVMC